MQDSGRLLSTTTNQFPFYFLWVLKTSKGSFSWLQIYWSVLGSRFSRFANAFQYKIEILTRGVDYWHAVNLPANVVRARKDTLTHNLKEKLYLRRTCNLPWVLDQEKQIIEKIESDKLTGWYEQLHYKRERRWKQGRWNKYWLNKACRFNPWG